METNTTDHTTVESRLNRFNKVFHPMCDPHLNTGPYGSIATQVLEGLRAASLNPRVQHPPRHRGRLYYGPHPLQAGCRESPDRVWTLKTQGGLRMLRMYLQSPFLAESSFRWSRSTPWLQ